jgi:amidase
MEGADLAFAGAARQAELVRAGEVSSRELTELYLERIERLDRSINAYRVVLGERALADADQADARRQAGEERPLLGVPIAIKDNVDLAGEVTTQGTGAYSERPAEEDAEIVKRLRGAGAVILGKTLLPELAIFPFTSSQTWGQTRNPWSTDRDPGGSSGGSAAAVAAGLAAVAHASDGGGSIRVPAANCGLVGLKPQRGRVSLMPDASHWYGLSVAGCVSRTVLDSALFLDVVRGAAPGDADSAPDPERSFVDAARTPPPPLRIATWVKPPQPGPVHADVKRAVADTAELLRGLGHRVERRDPSFGFELPAFLPRYLRGIKDEAGGRLPRVERVERRTRRMIQWGGLVSERAVQRALRASERHTERIARLFEEFDVLITPTLARTAERAGYWDGHGAFWTINSVARYIPFTIPWNLTGQPAAAVPAGLDAAGLPLSVQLVGRPSDESTLLSLAAQLEAERPWAERRPPVS